MGALVAALAAAIIAAIALPRISTDPDPIEIILAGSDPDEVAAAVHEIAQEPDPGSLQRLVDETAARPEMATHLEAIRDLMVSRLGNAAADDRIRILEALTVVDDPTSGAALVDALTSDDDPSVGAAAARLLPELDESLEETIASLIDARTSGSETKAVHGRIEDVLRAIGDPAVEAIAALQGEPRWTLDFLVSVGGPFTWLEELAASAKLSDLELAAGTLSRLERTEPAVAKPLWRELAGSLRGFVTSKAQRALRIATILQDVERAQPSLARPVQKKVVEALLPKLGLRIAGPAPDFTLSEALARLGKPAVDRLLPIARQRPGAFVAQSVINRADEARNALVTMISIDRDALKPLLDALKRRDFALVADLMNFYVQLGKPGSEPILIEAQNRHGDPLTAIAFLESGNKKLKDAAHSWAARNGYTITGSFSGPGTWGSAR